MFQPRVIIYDKNSGAIVRDCGWCSDVNHIKTDEELIITWKLQEYNRDVLGFIRFSENDPREKLFNTQYESIRIDVETEEIIFYGTPQEQEQFEELKNTKQLTQEVNSLKQQVSALGKTLVQYRLKEGETV